MKIFEKWTLYTASTFRTVELHMLAQPSQLQIADIHINLQFWEPTAADSDWFFTDFFFEFGLGSIGELESNVQKSFNNNSKQKFSEKHDLRSNSP